MSRRGRGVLPRAAATGFSAFWAAVLVAGAVNPGYSHVREFMSALAAVPARQPWIMMAGIASLSVATAAAGIELARRLRGPAATVTAVLLTLAGVAGLVAAVAQQDCSTALAACHAQESRNAVSGHHVVHELAALLAFVLAAVALLPLGRARRRWPVGLAGLFGLVLIAWMVLDTPEAVAGVVQRGFVLVVFGTPVLLATPRHTESAAYFNPSAAGAAGSDSARNVAVRAASSASPIASAARCSAASARRKPRLGSCAHGTGPKPFHPLRRSWSSPRW